ncbi:MAG TPA: hypothetical protein VGN32_18130, partial [Ktedonobacterales bacterium]|nr:hypothetical protein [Ktedonobacterales bacterium]
MGGRATVSNPDGSLDKHKYYATEGWGVYDNTQITNCAPNMQPQGPTPCPNVPWWDLTNVAHGHEYETDSYDTNGTTLLKKSTTQYQAVCPPVGVGATPPVTGYGNFKSHLVSELDLSNPVAVCDVQAIRGDSYTVDGSNAPGPPDATTTSVFDSFGRVSSTTTSSNDGRNVDRLEAESQTVGAHTAPTSIFGNGFGLVFSNNAELSINASAVGQYATLSFAAPTTGTYDLTVMMVRAADNGISTLAIDGKTVGQPFDGFNGAVAFAPPVDDGLVTLAAGTHQATWTATSKNPSSSNYHVSVDYFDLTLAGGPTSITHTTQYIQNNAISTSQTGATGTYLIDYPAFSDSEDSHGNRYACSYTSYDGRGYGTGQQSGLTLGEATTSDHYASSCGTAANGWTPSGLLRTTSSYDTYGNPLTTDDPDANAGNGAHLGCVVGSTSYSTCAAYDSTFATLPTTSKNALNQTSSTGY